MKPQFTQGLRDAARLVLAIYAFNILAFPDPSAMALENTSTNALGVSTANLTGATGDALCQSVCSNLLGGNAGDDSAALAGSHNVHVKGLGCTGNGGSDGQWNGSSSSSASTPTAPSSPNASASSGLSALGTSGAPTSAPNTSQPDDQWCADHYVPTDASVGPSVQAAVSPTPGSVPTLANGQTCNVPISPQEDNKAGCSCAQINQDMLHCKLHNSSVEANCLAYEQANDGIAWEYVLLALDLVTATVCTIACVILNTGIGALATGNTMSNWCTGLEIGVDAVQTILTETMNNDAVGRAVNGIAGGLGLTGGFIAVGADAATEAGRTGTKTVGNVMPCVFAVLMAIFAALRIAAIVNDGSTKGGACTNISNAMSSSTTAGASSAPDLNSNNYTPTNGSSGAGGGLGTGGGTTGGSSTGGSNPIASNPACQSGSLSGGCFGQAAGATDGGLIQNSGLSPKVIPAAANLDTGALKRQIDSGAGAGAIMGGALGASAGDTGAAVANLAQVAQDHAAELGASLGGYSGGGGGGGGGGAKGGSDGGLGALGGLFGGGGAGPAGPKATDSFGKTTAPDTDIFHASSPHSIFEIASEKFGKVATRVKTK
jgi:hypothetical protein